MDGTSLTNNIFLYEPTTEPSTEEATSDHSSPQAPAPPSLIILCTWQGGATIRRITRYISGYRTLYPNARILVIRTELADMTYRTTHTLHARLKPARRILTDHLHHHHHHNPSPDILLHFLSHGGCATAIQLLASLQPATRSELHARLGLLVSDCCPGDGSFAETYRAGLASLPPAAAIPRVLGAAALGGTVAVVYALHGLRVIQSVPGIRGELLDPGVFGARAARLYLASEGDRVIAAEDVAAHVRLAEDKGYRAELVRFEKGLHCALVLGDPVRYWGAISDGWGGQGRGEDIVPLSKL